MDLGYKFQFINIIASNHFKKLPSILMHHSPAFNWSWLNQRFIMIIRLYCFTSRPQKIIGQNINLIYLLYFFDNLLLFVFLFSYFFLSSAFAQQSYRSALHSFLAQVFISIFYSYSKCIIKIIFLLIQL